MVRQVIVLAILLASASFYNIIVIPRQVLLVLSFGSTLFMAVGIIFGVIYHREKGFKTNFAFGVVLFLLSAVFGMFGAYWGHGQSFLLTAWIQQQMYFYLLYFFLHTVRIKPEELMRLLLIMAFSFSFFYFVQYVLYPTKILDVRADVDRGTVRIFMPGLLFAEMIFYYYLHKLLKTNNLKYSVFVFVYLIIIILMGTRQVLAITGFGILALVLVSKQVRSRAMMLIMMASACLVVFIIFQDIFMEMMAVSEEQSAQDEDDIRVRSATFWLTDFQPMFLTYITGNGIGHQASAYGMRIWYYKEVFGFYQSDVGIIGSYSIYGAVSVLAFIVIIWRIFAIKVLPEYRFIKFWVLTLVFHSILGWPFFASSGITIIICALYLLDVSNYELRQKEYELKHNQEEERIETNLVVNKDHFRG